MCWPRYHAFLNFSLQIGHVRFARSISSLVGSGRSASGKLRRASAGIVIALTPRYNNGIPVAARENAWLAATVLCRFAVDDAHEEALVGGIIENHPDFIDEAPFNPWALVRDTLLSMRMRILCIKYLDMQATGSPSERERAIVCFWRAAPGEAGDVRYVERGEL